MSERSLILHHARSLLSLTNSIMLGECLAVEWTGLIGIRCNLRRRVQGHIDLLERVHSRESRRHTRLLSFHFRGVF